jgi:hypothetical protein
MARQFGRSLACWPALSIAGARVTHRAPFPLPVHVNAAQTEAELAALRRSVARGLPCGSAAWTQRTARRLGLEYTLRLRERPEKASAGKMALGNEFRHNYILFSSHRHRILVSRGVKSLRRPRYAANRLRVKGQTMKRLLLGGLVCAALVLLVKDITVAQTTEASLKDLPDFQTLAHRVAPYIDAAAMLQASGKDKASATLLKLAKDREHDDQVIVLCRMLFVPKAKGEFRRPLIGAAHFLGGTDYADWPLEPIEWVDGVPFVITQGYSLRGKAEPAEVYLKYCIENCAWNGVQFKPKSDQEMRKALDKLLASPKWKAQLDDAEKAFLSSQVR